MRNLVLAAAAAGLLIGANASAADPVKASTEGCEKWGLSESDLKSCNEQMAVAKSDSDRIAVQNRFQKGTTTPGVEPTTGTTTDTRAGKLPDQKKNAPGSGTQGVIDKKGTPERTP